MASVLAVWAPPIHLERGQQMSWELVGQLLENYGLPIVGLLAVSWAWWRERQANEELNAEVRQNACEMTAALVSVKDVADSFKESLIAIDTRLKGCDDHLNSLASEAHREMSTRLEAIEKKMIELTSKLS